MFKTETILQVLDAGGDVIVDCAGRTTAFLVGLVKRAAANDRKVTLTNLSGRPAAHLSEIASHGPGYVTLDFSR